MKALYISPLCSEKLLDQLRQESGINPGYAGQKFDRLMVKGFKKNNIDCYALSSIPVSRAASKKLFWNRNAEFEDGVSYRYMPFINFPVIRQFCLFIYSFFYVLIWGLKDKSDKFIIADVLNYTICTGSTLAARLIGLRCVGVVTDMPGLMVNASGTKTNILSRIRGLKALGQKSVYNYDAYVFLTEAMNKVINKHNVPYMIMEGLVDSDTKIDSDASVLSNTKNILYAGGLHERYGLKTLVEAFMRIKDDSYRLCIYGSGPFVNDLLEKYCKNDKRIQYMGVVPNSEVVNAEHQSILLVNPRPTTEAFTKFSFPSKNMEYMVSGRPLLTTDLPGMPSEYHEYVYVFESEDVLGFEKSIKQILSLDEKELTQKGQTAQRWILDNKNNKIQAARIIHMVEQIKD